MTAPATIPKATIEVVPTTFEQDFNKIWRPNAGQQERFLSCPTFEALFGGAAGSGKSQALLMEASRQINNPAYSAVLFRRTYAMLEDSKGLIQQSKLWYKSFGGIYRQDKHYWIFPSGSRIYFRYLDNDKALDNYQGAAYSAVMFDELTQFTEKQYIYLFSRVRNDADDGIRAYIRATCNPEPGWVKDRFVTTGIANKIGYFVRVQMQGTDEERDVMVTSNYPDAKSRSFIPATYRDNPKISPEYVSNFHQMDYVTRARLMDGNWDIEYLRGRVYPNWSSGVGGNIDASITYDPDQPVWWAVDDGYAHGGGPGTIGYHPRIVIIAQPTSIGGVNLLWEYCKTEVVNYETTIDEVLEYSAKRGIPEPEWCFVPSEASMFRGALWTHKSLRSVKSTHKVADGIRNMREFICDHNGVRLLKAHPDCRNLIYEMPLYATEEEKEIGDSGEVAPKKLNDHSCDATRYLLFHLRNSKRRDVT